MNAELIRRCVRAMAETGEGSLVPLCRKAAGMVLNDLADIHPFCEYISN